MRQDRRVSVSIDLSVGSIELPPGTVHIPAELELKEAGGGAGGGDLQKLLSKLTGVLGPQWVRTWQRAAGVIKDILPLLGRVGGVLIGVAAAIVGVVVALKAMRWVAEKVTAMLRLFFDIVKRIASALWRMNAAVIRFLAMPLRRVLGATVNVLRMFVGKLQEAGEWLVRIGQDFIRKAIDTFQNFEQQLANTVSVMGQFGEAAMEMRKQVGAAMIEITRTSRFMASDAAQAAYAVASAGFSTLAEVVAITEAAIMAAEATLTDLTQTTQITMAAINQFGLAASEATRVVNVFTAAVAQSPATFIKIGQAMEYAGPIANSFAISIEQTTAALMALFKQGRSGSRAGTELRIVLASMAKATDKMRDVMGQFGITMEELSPARVGIIGMIEVFEKLRDTIGQIGTVEAIYQAFPVRAASALVALLQVGSREVARMQEAITGTNTALMMQQDQLRTLQGAWKIFLSKAEELQYQLLERLSPALGSVVGELQDLVEWARKSGIVIQAGGLLGEGLLYVANLIRSLAAPAFEMLKDAAETLIPVIKGLGEVIGPLLGKWVETVFPLLVKIFAQLGRVLTSFLEQNGDAIIQWFKDFLQAGLDAANWLPNLLPSLKEIVNLFGEWMPLLAEAAQERLPKLLEIFESLPGALDRFLNTYLPLLIEGFDEFMGLAKQAVTDLLPKLLELFEGLGPSIAEGLGTTAEKLSQLMERLGTFLSDSEGIVRIFQDLAGAMRGLSEAAIPLLRMLVMLKAIEVVVLRIKMFFLAMVPGAIGEFAGKSFLALGVALEALEKMMPMLNELENLRKGTGPQGGPLGSGEVRGGLYTPAYDWRRAGARVAYTITYNVNSLEAMEEVQRRETAKMKDDESRQGKFRSAPDQGTPPTTIRTFQRSFPA